MKNKFILLVMAAILLFPTISTAEIKDNDINIIQDDITLSIKQSTSFIGVNLIIENTGTEILNDVEWSFRYKAAITGTGVFINEKIENGLIEDISPGTIETLSFIPFGLGNIYFNASVEVNDASYRTQQLAYLLLVAPILFKDTYKDISPAEAYQRLENEEFDLVIDVVGLDIYSLGHLPGAVNYVWADGSLRDKIPDLDPDLTYLFYCHTDPPSTESAQALVDAGFTDVFRLEGNFAAWKNAGYPVET